MKKIVHLVLLMIMFSPALNSQDLTGVYTWDFRECYRTYSGIAEVIKRENSYIILPSSNSVPMHVGWEYHQKTLLPVNKEDWGLRTDLRIIPNPKGFDLQLPMGPGNEFPVVFTRVPGTVQVKWIRSYQFEPGEPLLVIKTGRLMRIGDLSFPVNPRDRYYYEGRSYALEGDKLVCIKGEDGTDRVVFSPLK